MAGVHDAALLGSFLAEHEDRIVRRAARSLRYALDEAPSREHRKTAIPSYTGELASLLLERGDEAPRLWGEAVRHHGSLHFENRLDVGDLVREFQALQGAIVEEWDKRAGPIGIGVGLLLSECISEGTAAAVADYMRRVRGEQVEFRESALIETILEHLDEGILLIEADGTFSYATRPSFRLLGENLRASMGRHLTDPSVGKLLAELKASSLDGEPVIPPRLPAVRTLQTGESPGPTLMRVQPAGAEQILELTAIPIWDADRPGDPKRDLRGVITTVRDRTEDFRKTEELREKNRELADLHSRMLRRSRAQAMGELASGTSHALNNVLNAMHLRLRLLREAPGPDKIDALGKSVNELAELVARLQQFTAQKPSGPVESSDLDARIHEALALVRPEGRRAGEGAIHVRSELRHPPAVRANDAELREMLVSLLLYARDELGKGGELAIATDLSGRSVECRVQFRGKERVRPEALLEPLFEDDGAGPRLGLALGSAREALQRWGGDLQVRALDAGGAEIALTFAPADFVVEHHGPPAPAADTGQRRVLVIDDDPDNASMLAEVLAAEGHITDTATTGQEAIQKWEGGTFDIALVDLLMPDMPGTEIAAALRTTRPNARIALVTGWELDEQQRRTAPVQAVFRKPVDLSQLLAFLVPVDTQPAAMT